MLGEKARLSVSVTMQKLLCVRRHHVYSGYISLRPTDRVSQQQYSKDKADVTACFMSKAIRKVSPTATRWAKKKKSLYKRGLTPFWEEEIILSLSFEGFPGSSVGKESACSAGDPGLIPRLGRSTGEGKGCPLQYSGLENPMDCTVHGVTKSQTRLSDFHWSFEAVTGDG